MAALPQAAIGPAGSKNQGMQGISMRENREGQASPVARSAAGRSVKAEAARPR